MEEKTRQWSLLWADSSAQRTRSNDLFRENGEEAAGGIMPAGL